VLSNHPKHPPLRGQSNHGANEARVDGHHLIFDPERKELYVEVKTSQGTDRLGIDATLKLDGAWPGWAPPRDS